MCQTADAKSSWLNVECGVPQGSILGKLLFSIEINNLPQSCGSTVIYLFADDLNITGISYTSRIIQKELNRILLD